MKLKHLTIDDLHYLHLQPVKQYDSGTKTVSLSYTEHNDGSKAYFITLWTTCGEDSVPLFTLCDMNSESAEAAYFAVRSTIQVTR